MPRDGSGVYTKPYPSVVSGTTIESLVYNGQVDDVTADLNTARPIVSGGTGANNAAGGLFNLGGEKATQVVTSYDSHVWVPGSFRSAVGATGAPNATAIFSGVCYIHEAIANPPTNQNVTVEARDVTSGILYIRTKTAGAWSAWRTERDTLDAAPVDALAYNGMQINGSMEVSQEFGTTGTGAVNNYPADGWVFGKVGTSVPYTASGTYGVGGFSNALVVTVGTAQPTMLAADFVYVLQSIEGYRISRLAWGSGNAQPITIGFWVQHVRAGTYTGTVRNSPVTRTYAFTYTQAVGSAREYKTVTIPGCTDGTWQTGNGIGLMLTFAVACGTTYTAPSANTWLSNNYIAGPGQVNGVTAITDASSFTGVVVLPGIEAPPAATSALIMRPYDQEIVTCQRYWRQSRYGSGIAYSATAMRVFMPHFGMRAAPTISLSGSMIITDIVAGTATQSSSNLSSPSPLADSSTLDLGNFTGLTSSKFYAIHGTSPTVKFDARL